MEESKLMSVTAVQSGQAHLEEPLAPTNPTPAFKLTNIELEYAAESDTSFEQDSAMDDRDNEAFDKHRKNFKK